jgi:hypothetical protein
MPQFPSPNRKARACNPNVQITDMLKVTNTKVGTLLPMEGVVYDAKVKAVSEKAVSKILKEFGFSHGGKDFVVTAEYPKKWTLDSPLFKDAQTILARPFTPGEINEGFDLEKLVGLECRVVTANKKTSGGKLKSVVTAVLPKEANLSSEPIPSQRQ